jgi:hypothetical protein
MIEMVRLSVHDSSVLSRLAQYTDLPEEDKRRILAETSSPTIQTIGRLLLGESIENASPELKQTAAAFRAWAEANQRDREGRLKARFRREPLGETLT